MNHEEVVEFLKSVGGNERLGEILEEKGEFRLGPIGYPIAKLSRIMGPEKYLPYPETEEVWEDRVGKMVEEIKSGWKPKPLIATNLWVDHFTLADGNHRQEALLRCGINSFPTIFYFKTKEDMVKFVEHK